MTKRPNVNGVEAPQVVSAPGLVGRGRELSTLEQALSARSALVLVEGEAGLGKTRLVQEFLSEPRDGGRAFRALSGACPPFREPHTLGPVVDALRQGAERVAGLRLSGLTGALRPLFPEWADQLPEAPEPLDDPWAARHRLFRALAELLGALSVDVLVVEDVHWADDATLEFLLFLVSGQPTAPGVVVTYRPEDVPADSLLRRLSSRNTPTRITLAPLDVDQTAQLISSMMDGEPVSQDFAEFLHHRTDGLPLAVEESVRLMADRGDLARFGDGWMRLELDELDIPPTIRDAVLERTARLGADAQAVLRATAVLTDPTDARVVVAVTGLPEEQAFAGLGEAVASGLLQEDRRGLVAFRHVLRCAAIYETIPASHRRVLHLRAGRALEQTSPLPLAQLARHFREAEAAEEWARYAEQAADIAVLAGDDATAAALFCDLVTDCDASALTVLRYVEKLPFASLTGPANLQHLMGTLRRMSNDPATAPGSRAQVGFELATLLMMTDQNEEGRLEMGRMLPHLTHDLARTSRAMLYLGWPRDPVWPRSRHRRWLRRAVDTMPRIPEAGRLRLIVDVAVGSLMLGDPDGWALAGQLPADVSTGPERWQLARAGVNLGDLALRWGRYDDAAARLATALHIADLHQHMRYRDMLLACRLHLELLTGSWDGLHDRAVVLATDHSIQPTAQLEAALVLGVLHSAAGRTEQAEEVLGQVLHDTLTRGLVESCTEPAAALARTHLAQGRVDEALAVTEQPVRIVTTKGIWLWATEVAPARVEALLAAGRGEEAAELVSAFSHGLRGCTAASAHAGLATCQALLAEHHTHRDDPAHSAAAYARAAAAWARLPRPYEALLARERHARWLVAAGATEAALAHLSLVHSELVELGAGGDAARVAALLDAHGVRRTRRGRRGYGIELSPRELEVVRLVATGLTNREIATALSRSPKTIGGQVDSAMRKLGVSSRTALAVAAVEAGLVEIN